MSNHQIVIIGASFAGITAAKHLFDDVFPTISGKTFKVTQIAPSDHFYWKIGAPRTVINPQSLPLDKTLVDIKPAFSKYGEKYEFIQASATSIDHASKTVKLSNDAAVTYDTLILASGTSFDNDLWSNSRGAEPLKAALRNLQEKLPAAQTVVIGGGGPAGVETAGELGDSFGSKKDVTLYSGTTQLLNRLNNKNVGKDAESRLVKQGIKVVHGVQITSHRSEGGKEVLQLSNGETKTVDLYIPAVGDKPSSGYVPKDWLDEKGRVLTDAKTLRLAVEGVTGVYVYGTVASYSDGSIADVMFAKKPLIETLKSDLAGNGKCTDESQPWATVLICAQNPLHAPRTSTTRSPATCSSFLSARARVWALPSAGSFPALLSRWPSRRTS
jgi:apoptosis-inducing factor 2